jgi:hypothetical protein
MPVPACPTAPLSPDLPLGQDPAERVPIPNAVAAIEAILREPRRVLYQLQQPGAAGLAASLMFLAVACGLVYGLIMGTFSGGEQLWAAPVKTAAGLVASGLICLPSLYIFACLSGSRGRLVSVFGLLTGLLALATVLLIGFAPVAWIFSQSTLSVTAMGALHILFWMISAYFGLRFLRAGFMHLGARRASAIEIWSLIFLLVSLQMTTALRPLVGSGQTLLPIEKKFFITHWIDSMK